MPSGVDNRLTSREQDVFEGLARGFSNKEIAVKLGISYNTVVTHVYNIFRKLGINNRKEAIIRALVSSKSIIN